MLKIIIVHISFSFFNTRFPRVLGFTKKVLRPKIPQYKYLRKVNLQYSGFNFTAYIQTGIDHIREEEDRVMFHIVNGFNK